MKTQKTLIWLRKLLYLKCWRQIVWKKRIGRLIVTIPCVDYNRRIKASVSLLILSIINAKLETKYAKWNWWAQDLCRTSSKTVFDVTVFVNIKFITESKNYTFLLFLTKDIWPEQYLHNLLFDASLFYTADKVVITNGN